MTVFRGVDGKRDKRMIDMTIEEYIGKNDVRFIEEWSSLVSIPSVSSEVTHKGDMVRCAERWCELLQEAGADRVEVMSSAGNPFVYGEYRSPDAGRDTPVVLVYGHYDVMPVEPLSMWTTDPWHATIKGNRLYGRGADDDKGQSMIQKVAFEYIRKFTKTPVHVKFILEGEEEIGSPSLHDFISRHRDLLRCDIILVSDTSMLSKELPSITTGLRGLAYWQIEVAGPNRDLHSGHFGGAVKNPINALCEILSRMVDDSGVVSIPHFYDDVLELSLEERSILSSIPFSVEAYKAKIGIDDVFGEEGYSTIERNAYRPSLDVCGIWGGHTGEGSKTVIPSSAYAKVSARLVPNQDYEKIRQLFIDYVKSVVPRGVRVSVTPMHGGAAYLCPTDLPAYRAAEKAFETAFGKRPIPLRRGGSIPIISDFEKTLGSKTILMGFGLEENAIHSPNESMDIEVWRKGIVAVVNFYKNLYIRD